MADFWPGLFGFGSTKIAVGRVEGGEIAMRHLTRKLNRLRWLPVRHLEQVLHEVIRLLRAFPELLPFFGEFGPFAEPPDKVNGLLRTTCRVTTNTGFEPPTNWEFPLLG